MVIKFKSKSKITNREETPSMEDMFKRGDKIKQKRRYTTEEIIKISHELRVERYTFSMIWR